LPKIQENLVVSVPIEVIQLEKDQVEMMTDSPESVTTMRDEDDATTTIQNDSDSPTIRIEASINVVDSVKKKLERIEETDHEFGSSNEKEDDLVTTVESLLQDHGDFEFITFNTTQDGQESMTDSPEGKNLFRKRAKRAASSEFSLGLKFDRDVCPYVCHLYIVPEF